MHSRNVDVNGDSGEGSERQRKSFRLLRKHTNNREQNVGANTDSKGRSGESRWERGAHHWKLRKGDAC